MSAVVTENDLDEEWTPQRLRCLAALATHMTPPPDTANASSPDIPAWGQTVAWGQGVALYVAHALALRQYSGQAALVWALLDELEERPEPFTNLPGEPREALLRELETHDNAYLVYALKLLLQLSIEGAFGGFETGHPRAPGSPPVAELGIRTDAGM